MSMIFLDVGAHRGQTLDEVLKPVYSWDTIYAFEPMPFEFECLKREYVDDRLHLENYGLLDETASLTVYGDNSKMEASIYSTHSHADPSIKTQCSFVAASEFFKENIPTGQEVIVKLNCEGSEVRILRNLLVSGEIWKITNVMIDFDVRKCKGQEHEEASILAELNSAGFSRYSLCDDVVMGRGPTHQDRIAYWLRTIL